MTNIFDLQFPAPSTGEKPCARCDSKHTGLGPTCESCTDELEREARERRDEIGVKLGIPPTFRRSRVDAEGWDGTPWALQLAAAGRSAGELARMDRVIFAGETGAGKTSLACALLRLRAPNGRGARFVWSVALSTARAQHPLGAGEAPLVSLAKTVPLLCLDDLGDDRPNELSPVAEVLKERHARGAATWITTGLGARALAERYGGHLWRRISEDAEIVTLAKYSKTVKVG